MSQPLRPEVTELFEHGNPKTPGILGGGDFMDKLPYRARRRRGGSKEMLDQISSNVACSRGVEREHILSNSGQHEFLMARVLIAWHATERRVATLTEVACYLRRDPSTLSKEIKQYRTCRPSCSGSTRSSIWHRSSRSAAAARTYRMMMTIQPRDRLNTHQGSLAVTPCSGSEDSQ